MTSVEKTILAILTAIVLWLASSVWQRHRFMKQCAAKGEMPELCEYLYDTDMPIPPGFLDE